MDVNKLCLGCMRMRSSEKGKCEFCGFDKESYQNDVHQLQLNTILNGKYLIGKVLGEGGFGITYIGIDLSLNRPVAVKEYYPNGFVYRNATIQGESRVTKYKGEKADFFEKGLHRFFDEARSVAQFFDTSGIAQVLEVFKENDTAYIVMEYVDGITLKEYLKQSGGKVDVDTALALMRPVIRSLARVHETGLIHRDISPDNIMINKKGDLKLLDFGAARKYEDSENKSLSIMLKPGYAPEEQYLTKGHQGTFTDVYAVSATIYKMITGKTPPESLGRKDEDSIAWPSSLGIPITERVEAVLKQGMAVLAKDRIQNMEELEAVLYEEAEEESPVIGVNTAANTAVKTASKTLSKSFAKKEEKQKKAALPKMGNPKKVAMIAGICALAGGGLFGIVKLFGAGSAKLPEGVRGEVKMFVENHKREVDTFLLDEGEKTKFEEIVKSIENSFGNKDDDETLLSKKEDFEKFLVEIVKKNEEILAEKMVSVNEIEEKMRFLGQEDKGADKVRNFLERARVLVAEGRFSEADEVLEEAKKGEASVNFPENYSFDLEMIEYGKFPEVKLRFSVKDREENLVKRLGAEPFQLCVSREASLPKEKVSGMKVSEVGGSLGKYEVSFTVPQPGNLESGIYLSLYLDDKKGNGGIFRTSYSLREYGEKLYADYVEAQKKSGGKGERILNSNLFITGGKEENLLANRLKDFVAAGSHKAGKGYSCMLQSGEVLEAERTEDHYVIWTYAEYKVRDTGFYTDLKEEEKAFLLSELKFKNEKEFLNQQVGKQNVSFYLEKIVGNYEKIELMQDVDGVWKLGLLTTERKDGGEAFELVKLLSAGKAS